MKRQLLILIFLIFYSFYAKSQEVLLGVKGGVNFSEWKGDDSYTSGVYQGFFLGPSISLKASDKISIEPSILLSKKGTKLKRMIDVEEDGESLFLDSRHVYTLTYIDVPVVVRYDILPGLNLFIGPQFSYLLKNKAMLDDYRIINKGEGKSIKRTEKDIKGYNKFDLALTGGVGYLFNNGFNISLGYDFGFYDLKDHDWENENYNRVMKISIGYIF